MLMKPFYWVLLSSVLCSGNSWATDFELPLWREEVEAQGYVLPKPFGLNISYMGLEQAADINSIAFSGLAIPSITVPLPEWLPEFVLPEVPLSDQDIVIEANPASQHMDVLTLRGDVWLLPFLNFYGLVGKTTGYSETSITIDSFKGLPVQFVPAFNDVDFRLDLDGYLYGVGAVLAGGYESWFGLVDISYTQTQLTVIDGNIASRVILPRIGYDFSHHTSVPLRIWIGAMHQKVEQSLSGSLTQLHLPQKIQALLNVVNQGKNGAFHVEQSLSSPWNGLIGAQYQWNDSINLLLEVGLGERKSAFFTVDFRV